MKKYLLQAVLILIAAFFNVIQAQQNKGSVVTEDQLPIPKVHILIDNELVATTNAKGEFILLENFKLPIEIAFQHPKYESQNELFSNNNQFFILKKSVDVQSLNPIVLNVLNDKKSKIITPITTIGIESIEQQSPVDIVSSINQTPGIYIQSGAINTNRIVIRGVGSRTLYGSNKIRAYFNDILITNGVGETEIDSYNPEDLQSIEIIKGPKATAYGTSLGGTMLLTSKKSESSGITLNNSTTVGSFGLLKNSISSSFADEKFQLNLNYDHLETDGFRENSQYNKNGILLNTSYAFNEKTQLSLLMNFVDYTAQIPSSISKSAFEEDPSQAAFTWKIAQGYETDASVLTGISLKHNFSETFINTTSLFYSYSDHYEPRPFNILDEFTNRFGLRTVFTKSFNFLNRNAEWSTGGELNKDEYHWKTIENLYRETNGNGSLAGMLLSDNEEYRQQLNLFTTVTLPIYDKMTLQFGVNYNKTTYDFQDQSNSIENNKSASRNFDAIIAPNLNLIYQFSQNQNVFGNISYGFNHPTLEESLTPEGISNPDIGPEKGFNYEIGSEMHFFHRKWHILTSVYLLNIQDLLVSQRVGDDQYIGRNAGQTIHKGLEISTDYKFQLNKNISISPYLNASFNSHRFEEFVSENNDYSGNKLTGVPNMTVASGLGIKFKNLAIYSNHLYVGELPMNDANSLYSDAYNTINLKLVYETTLFKTLKCKLNFGVNNIFDSQYASSILINATGFNNSEPRYYYPGNPLNYYGGVSLRYQL